VTDHGRLWLVVCAFCGAEFVFPAVHEIHAVEAAQADGWEHDADLWSCPDCLAGTTRREGRRNGGGAPS
jgi:hypothetical protein